MPVMDFIVAALIWAGIVVVSMLVASWLAVRWGRDPFGWALLAAVLGPIALVGLAGTRQSDLGRQQTPGEPHTRASGQRCIVAAVDGSEASLRVARYVAGTHPTASEVALLAVLPQESRPGGGAAPDDEHQQRVAGMVGESKKIISGAGIPVRVVVAYGSPGEAIVRAADDENADMVIVGRRGAGLSRALLGSASDHVVKHSKRTVVVIE
jgi:nucleotide-binding universal stress UspA family protein